MDNNTSNNEPNLIGDIVKEYPTMLKIVIYHNNYSLPTKTVDADYKKLVKKQNKEDSIHRSVRRTRATISDIIICNEFDLWTTFTFDKRKVDRYDVNRCKTVMSNWLRNQTLHSPKLKYLIVPEFHKDGALHFHALLKNFNGPLKDSGKKTQLKQTIYNLSGYRSGFSTAVCIGSKAGPSDIASAWQEPGDTLNDVMGTASLDYQSSLTNNTTKNTSQSRRHSRLNSDSNSTSFQKDTTTKEDYQRVASYIQKYITKDMPLIYGKKRFWCSTGLVRPVTHINGIATLRLKDVIFHHKPSYINDYYEIQHHRKINTPLNEDLNVAFL